MHIRTVFAALAVVLSGCQTAYVGDEQSPFYAVPAGARLTLNQELKIPADALSVFIQNGRVLRETEVQHYYPFCKFELYDASSTARTVQPDEIVVTKSVQRRLKGVSAQAAPVMVAGTSFGLAGVFKDDGPTFQSFSTQMYLRSDKQPNIFRLSCARWDDPGMGTHVSIAEIRRTLDGVFTLHVPQQ